MKIGNMRYIAILFSLFLFVAGQAQKNERSLIRKGNNLYKDSLYVKAEVEYRKALEMNPKSVTAKNNLGCALFEQQKTEEAVKAYSEAANMVSTNERGIAQTKDDCVRLSALNHNRGYILQKNNQLDACIEAYKQALRNDPTDNEARYNLTVALKHKKEQEQQQQNQDQNQQQEEKKEEQQQQQEQQQQDREQKEQEQPQEQQPQEQDMSKENAEQMLNAVMQDEKELQEKVKKAMQEAQPRKFEKDW